MIPHQYIDRDTGSIRTEKLYGDRFISWLYSEGRERVPALYRAVTGARMSSLLGFFNYSDFIGGRISGNMEFMRRAGIDLSECVDDPRLINTPRKIFERKIRYWETRPMPRTPSAIVSPCDARVVTGSLSESSPLFIKGKFFEYRELLGADKPGWLTAFGEGDFAIFRLTPEKYHYNHSPVSGAVADFYEMDGAYHSCNPTAVINVITPLSKNKRSVTIIDSDAPGGTGVGMVAMIEVSALMIGGVEQRYSPFQYENPVDVRRGLFLEKGQPKSLFRPGSSTVILFFQKGKIRFENDLTMNQSRVDPASRYSFLTGKPMVETDISVRSIIATSLEAL